MYKKAAALILTVLMIIGNLPAIAAYSPATKVITVQTNPADCT